MQDLAESSAAEVAKTLGVSRDNAYQRVNCGLVTLLALLASEGHATSVGGTSDTTFQALPNRAMSSNTAVNLAAGVTTAMILTAPSTIMMMAVSLLLVVGGTAVVVAAESAPPAELAIPAPVQPASLEARTAQDKAMELAVDHRPL